MELSENAILKLDRVRVFRHSSESEVQALIDPHCVQYRDALECCPGRNSATQCAQKAEEEEAEDRRAEEEDEGIGGGSDGDGRGDSNGGCPVSGEPL